MGKGVYGGIDLNPSRPVRRGADRRLTISLAAAFDERSTLVRRILTVAVTVAALGALAVGASAASSGATGANTIAEGALKVPTVKLAGLQHWCGTNGVECSDPSVNWDEIGGYAHAVKAG